MDGPHKSAMMSGRSRDAAKKKKVEEDEEKDEGITRACQGKQGQMYGSRDIGGVSRCRGKMATDVPAMMQKPRLATRGGPSCPACLCPT